jgi:hypothetical protein
MDFGALTLRSKSERRSDGLRDCQSVDHAFELLPDMCRKGRRGATHAAYFATTVEVMSTVEGNVLRRLLFKKK